MESRFFESCLNGRVDDLKEQWESKEVREKILKEFLNKQYSCAIHGSRPMFGDHLWFLDVFKYNVTPLMAAAFSGHASVVRFLLDSGADIMAKNNSNESALSWATLGGKQEIFDLLVQSGAQVDIELAAKDGCTLLHQAVIGGCMALVQRFLQLGADVTARAWGGASVLDFAAMTGDLDMFQYLTKASGNSIDVCISFSVSWKGGEDEGWTLLHSAAAGGNVDLVKAILDNGAVPCISKTRKHSPLTHAASFGHLEVLKLLIQVAPQLLHELDEWKRPVLLCAIPYLSVVRFLVEEKSMDIDVSDAGGTNPFHYACWFGCLPVIRYFLERDGSLLHSKNNAGSGGLDFAIFESRSLKKNAPDVFYFLLDQGLDTATAKNLPAELGFDLENGILKDMISQGIEQQEIPKLIQNILSAAMFEHEGILYVEKHAFPYLKFLFLHTPMSDISDIVNGSSVANYMWLEFPLRLLQFFNVKSFVTEKVRTEIVKVFFNSKAKDNENCKTLRYCALVWDSCLTRSIIPSKSFSAFQKWWLNNVLGIISVGHYIPAMISEAVIALTLRASKSEVTKDDVLALKAQALQFLQTGLDIHQMESLDDIITAFTLEGKPSLFDDDSIISHCIEENIRDIIALPQIFECIKQRFYSFNIVGPPKVQDYRQTPCLFVLSLALCDAIYFLITLLMIWHGEPNVSDASWHQFALLFFSIGYLYDELCQLHEKGFNYYARSAWNFWDAIILITFFSWFIIITMSIDLSFKPVNIIAMNLFSVPFRSLQYGSLSQTTAAIVSILHRMVLDTLNFLLPFSVIIVGFALWFMVLFEDVDGFESFTASVGTLLDASLGNYDFDELCGGSWVRVSALALYLFITFLLALNLLIAVLTDTYAQISCNRHLEWSLTFSEIVKDNVTPREWPDCHILPAPLCILNAVLRPVVELAKRMQGSTFSKGVAWLTTFLIFIIDISITVGIVIPGAFFFLFPVSFFEYTSSIQPEPWRYYKDGSGWQLGDHVETLGDWRSLTGRLNCMPDWYYTLRRATLPYRSHLEEHIYLDWWSPSAFPQVWRSLPHQLRNLAVICGTVAFLPFWHLMIWFVWSYLAVVNGISHALTECQGASEKLKFKTLKIHIGTMNKSSEKIGTEESVENPLHKESIGSTEESRRAREKSVEYQSDFGEDTLTIVKATNLPETSISSFTNGNSTEPVLINRDTRFHECVPLDEIDFGKWLEVEEPEWVAPMQKELEGMVVQQGDGVGQILRDGKCLKETLKETNQAYNRQIDELETKIVKRMQIEMGKMQEELISVKEMLQSESAKPREKFLSRKSEKK